MLAPQKLLFVPFLKQYPAGCRLMKKRTHGAAGISRIRLPVLSSLPLLLAWAQNCPSKQESGAPGHAWKAPEEQYECLVQASLRFRAAGARENRLISPAYLILEVRRLASDQPTHRPHPPLAAGPDQEPGSHPPRCLLQPPTGSNYFHVKCLVYKKSMYSHPTEMKTVL